MQLDFSRLEIIDGVCAPGLTDEFVFVPPTVSWNPSDKGSGITLSNGDLTATGNNTNLYGVRATLGRSSGKYYFEIHIDSVTGGASNLCIGFANSDFVITSGAFFGVAGDSWGAANFPAFAWGDGSFTPSGFTWTAGNVIGVAVDLTAGKFWLAQANAYLPTGANPATGANPYFANVNGIVYPCVVCKTAGVTARFTSSSFTFSPPSGYSAWGD